MHYFIQFKQLSYGLASICWFVPVFIRLQDDLLISYQSIIKNLLYVFTEIQTKYCNTKPMYYELLYAIYKLKG